MQQVSVAAIKSGARRAIEEHLMVRKYIIRCSCNDSRCSDLGNIVEQTDDAVDRTAVNTSDPRPNHLCSTVSDLGGLRSATDASV